MENNEENILGPQNNFQEGNNYEDGNPPKRFFDFIRDAIPSFLLLVFTSLSLSQRPQCTTAFAFLLNIYFFFGIIYLFKSVLSFFIYSTSQDSLCVKISKSTNYIWSVTLSISYYVFTVYSYVTYSTTVRSNCLKTNPVSSIVLFALITLGLIDIFRNILYIFGIIIGFPCFVRYFLSDPLDFITRYGIDPVVIDEWPTTKAKEKDCLYCAICNANIKINDDVFILKCDERHVFHSVCIKPWLKVKIECPLCRSRNIL